MVHVSVFVLVCVLACVYVVCSILSIYSLSLFNAQQTLCIYYKQAGGMKIIRQTA